MDEKPSYEQLTRRVHELESALADRKKRRQQESCAPENKEQCRQMIESLSELISRFDAEGTITFVNKAFCSHFDVPPEKLIGSSLFDLIPTEDHAATKQFLGTLTPQNPIGIMEHRMITKGGGYRWFQCNYCTIFDADGRLTEYQSVGRDVTAEAVLRKSKAKYSAIMDAMQDGVYVCSPENRIEYMNRAMIERIGHDATGEYCYKAIYDNDEKCPWCLFERVAQGEQINHELTASIDKRYYSVSNSPINYSEGGVSKLTIFRDLTELKAVEEQLHQSEKMASLARLAGGIAYDLNNILMGFNGYSELLVDLVPTGSEARQNLDQVLVAGQRAKRLISQIIQFIRPEESNEVMLYPAPMVADVLSFMRSSLPATIEIRQSFSDTNLILIDKDQLSRVVMNLCTNAAHAMKETGGSVTISLSDTNLPNGEMKEFSSLSQGAYVELKVSDTGPGMDAQTVRKIFDPYFTTKDKSEGTGLGLSIVHSIVSAVKGAIRVESQPGKGATFQVLLPAVVSSRSHPEVSRIEKDNTTCGHNECVLLVDDEPSLVLLGRKRLELLGYKVIAETDPVEALNKFKKQPDAFNLVITDMTMPRLTGDKLAKQITAIRPELPVILCTGFNRRIDEETSKKIGIKALLNKPISIDELAEGIDQALNDA